MLCRGCVTSIQKSAECWVREGQEGSGRSMRLSISGRNTMTHTRRLQGILPMLEPTILTTRPWKGLVMNGHGLTRSACRVKTQSDFLMAIFPFSLGRHYPKLPWVSILAAAAAVGQSWLPRE